MYYSKAREWLAVDGDSNGDWSQDSCTSTAYWAGTSPWWAVDLGRETSVLKVTIFNRIDCCREFSIALCDVIRENPLRIA